MTNYYARNIDVPNGVSATNGVIPIDYFYSADATDRPQDAGPFLPYTNNINVSNLRAGCIVSGYGRVHNSGVQPAQCQIDKLLDLPVVTSDCDVPERLNIAFRECHSQYSDRQPAQIIRAQLVGSKERTPKT